MSNKMLAELVFEPRHSDFKANNFSQHTNIWHRSTFLPGILSEFYLLLALHVYDRYLWTNVFTSPVDFKLSEKGLTLIIDYVLVSRAGSFTWKKLIKCCIKKYKQCVTVWWLIEIKIIILHCGSVILEIQWSCQISILFFFNSSLGSIAWWKWETIISQNYTKFIFFQILFSIQFLTSFIKIK